MKKIILRIILLILLGVTFYIIFGFSNQNGDESSSISRKVTEYIVNLLPNIQSETDKTFLVEHGEIVVRKLAHFSIYTIVGILMMLLMYTFKLETYKKTIISLVVGGIYAISDECHQIFIPGRGPSVTDVFIDTLGVLVGIIIVIVLISIYKKLFVEKKKIIEI